MRLAVLWLVGSTLNLFSSISSSFSFRLSDVMAWTAALQARGRGVEGGHSPGRGTEGAAPGVAAPRPHRCFRRKLALSATGSAGRCANILMVDDSSGH